MTKLTNTQLAMLSGIDFKQIAREMAAIAEPYGGWDKFFSEQQKLQQTFQAFADDLKRQMEIVTRALNIAEPFRDVLAAMARDERKYGLVEAAGWLPHYTTPFDAIPAEADTEAVAAQLAAFYREEWPGVRKQMLSKLDACDVDDEAKDTFLEALDAHQSGFFRYAPRVLFPELERVVRDEFFPGDLNMRLASQPQLIDAVSSLPGVEVTNSFVAGLRLYKKLARHLYIRVVSPDALASVRADPVPNRHAALHGLAVYKTQQNSLNAIIMAEFAFHLVAQFKRYAREQDAANAAA
jgi:hypothetical protein